MTAGHRRRTVSHSQIRRRWTAGLRLARSSRSSRCAVAVAHSILQIACHILDRGQPYAELGGDWLLKRESASAHAKRLVHQLEWG